MIASSGERTKRSYAVVGVGAVGGYYGGRLAHAGHETHFVLRSDHAHVAANGLRVDSVDGDFVVEDARVCETVEGLPEVDVALVALKTTADDALHEMARALAERCGAIVLMQNGYGNEERLASVIDLPLIAGLCFICSTKPGPGHIVHQDYGPVTLAMLGTDDVPPIVAGIAEDLRAAGVAATAQADLEAARWKKLCWNMPFNGLSVVLRATNQELLSDPAGRALVRSLMDEVALGASACGHPLPEGFIDKMIADTEVMTPYLPSMRTDFDAGVPMEIAAIYDRPIAAAAAAGVELPRLAAVAHQLSYLDQSNRRT